MPTDQPSNAPPALPDDADDIDTMAEVLADEDMDDPPGGGGLGGQAAAEGAPEQARPQSAATRSTPMTPEHAADDAPNRAADEAKVRSLDIDATTEPHPKSL